MKYIVERLKEPGTYRIAGAAIAGIFGTTLAPEVPTLAFQVVSGVLLLWEALMPSAKKEG